MLTPSLYSPLQHPSLKTHIYRSSPLHCSHYTYTKAGSITLIIECNKMCLKPELAHLPVLYSTLCYHKPRKGHRLKIHRLHRNRRTPKEVTEEDAEMKNKNIMLYMKNKSIIEENEKLRKKAIKLHQEIQALLSRLQNKNSQTKNFLVHKI